MEAQIPLSYIIGGFGFLITAVISWFLKDTLKTLRDSLQTLKEAVKESTDKLNDHSQKLGLLEQSIITLNLAIAKMADIEVRLVALEQNKNQELLVKDIESIKKDVDHIDKNVKQYAENGTVYFKICDQNTLNIEQLIKLAEKHEKKFDEYDTNILVFYRDHMEKKINQA